MRRVFLIVQLCLAFSYLFWLFGQPLVRDHLYKKSSTALFMGLFEREEAFAALSAEKQEELKQGFQAVVEAPRPSYWEGIGGLLVEKRTLFGLAWAVCSIVLAYSLLKGRDGVRPLLWILPLLVIGYATAPRAPPADSIFPPEAYVIEKYGDGVAKPSREELQAAWYAYLDAEWGGLYAFNVARVERIIAGREEDDLLLTFQKGPGLLTLLLYFAWNGMFAWIHRSRSAPASAPS